MCLQQRRLRGGPAEVDPPRPVTRPPGRLEINGGRRASAPRCPVGSVRQHWGTLKWSGCPNGPQLRGILVLSRQVASPMSQGTDQLMCHGPQSAPSYPPPRSRYLRVRRLRRVGAERPAGAAPPTQICFRTPLGKVAYSGQPCIGQVDGCLGMPTAPRRFRTKSFSVSESVLQNLMSHSTLDVL